MILITGATGFLGKEIIRRISGSRDDIRILAVDYENARRMYPGYDVLKGDITDRGSLKGMGKDVDTVIHLAGLVSYKKPKDEIFRVNYQGTWNVAEACREADKFIFSSSVSVYGEIIEGKANEMHPTNPVNYYGESKLDAELAITDFGIPHVIFRIAPVYGKGSPNWETNLSMLERGFPIPNTDNLTHMTHVSNAVRAFELACSKKATGIFNIADREPVKFTDLACKIVGMLGKKPKVLPFWLTGLMAALSGKGPYLRVLTMNRNYDVSKASGILGYDPEDSLEANLKEMTDWYKGMKKEK